MVKVDLHGPRETMLVTLYLRAAESKKENPLLVDRMAEDAVERLDYDFAKLGMTPKSSASVAIRAKGLDDWARRILADAPEITVLQLGCGLDTRVFRLDPPETVEWYDVDFPEVIELHRQLYPQRAHHHTIASSVTNPALFDEIPRDKPVLVIAEGLTMYLSTLDGVALLRRIVEHFPAGDLIFDAFNSLGIVTSNRFNPPVVKSGSRLEWAIDDPRELERAVPGLHLGTELPFTEMPEINHFPAAQRFGLRAMNLLSVLRRLGRMLHYRFGAAR